jgi:hypothetical protein
MSKVKFVLLGALFVSILVACSSGQPALTAPSEIVALPSNTPTATFIPTKTATAAATITPSPTQPATPVPTATSSPSPAPTPDPSCLEPGSAAPFAYPADTTELQASILAYLNAGGQWQDLMTLLDELEIEHDWVQADMNGDGVEETAVFTEVLDEHNSNDQAWMIFSCQSKNYKLGYLAQSYYGFHDYFQTEDIDNDGNLEIISVGGAARSACTSGVFILGMQDSEIIEYAPDYSVDCSYDENRVVIDDIDGDGIKEIKLSGWTVSHLDYAPSRLVTYTFSLEDSKYELLSTEMAPSDLRIHILDDAQRALNDENLNLALEYYNQAAYDNTLESTYSYNFGALSTAKELDFPEEYQRAFALFRLVTIQRMLDNSDDANIALKTLVKTYSENQPGHEFVVLAQIFIDAFSQDENLDDACRQVKEFILENYSISPSLTSHFYWGSNIAFYQTPESFCPIFTIPIENKP